jgi:hypothetical protein
MVAEFRQEKFAMYRIHAIRLYGRVQLARLICRYRLGVTNTANVSLRQQ